jgi:hypothetical protein
MNFLDWSVIAIIMTIVSLVFAVANHRLTKTKTELASRLREDRITYKYHHNKIVGQNEKLILELGHLREMLDMYEGKENSHFKLVNKLTDDYASLCTVRNMWIVLDTMRSRSHLEDEIAPELDKLHEYIFDQIRLVLFPRSIACDNTNFLKSDKESIMEDED